MEESGIRFSQSMVWHLQRVFFDTQGVRAWGDGIIPQYVTSNPRIAKNYAEMVVGYLQDYHRRFGPSQEPFYIVELGAGSGCFSYYFLKQFQPLLERAELEDIPFVYVMTDFATANIRFWREHEALSPFVESGVLDFAKFDAQQDASLELLVSGTTLGSGSMTNPGIFIANYFFDSLPHDLFYAYENRLYEVQVRLSSDLDSAPDDPRHLERLDMDHEAELIEQAYYEDPTLDHILDTYRQQLHDCYVRFPIVAIQTCRVLRALCNDRMLLMCADKGYFDLEDMATLGPPGFLVHGSISMEVNFHALLGSHEPVNHLALKAQRDHKRLNILALLLDDDLSHLRRAPEQFEEHFERFSPEDFFAMKKGIEPHYEAMSLNQLLAWLRFSRGDGRIFLQACPALMDKLENISTARARELQNLIEEVWSFYFHIGETFDLPHQLGLLLTQLRQYRDALVYFKRSLHYNGQRVDPVASMAVCHYHLSEWQEANECAQQVLAQEPGHALMGRLCEEMRRLGIA